jgi:Replication-relaxation
MTKLTSRDRKILRAVGACQVLATGQVHRWHFLNVSLNMAQKRLRKLVEAGYLDALETKVCTDNLLVLGKEGQLELQQHGWNVELKKELPRDLAHHMGVVDMRIAIERGLEHMPALQLRYFYAYWQLGRFAWSYPVIPDAIFSVRNAYTAQAALEFDRKTETLGVFAQKLLQYRLLLHRHPLSTVMVVAEESKDIERLQQGLEQVGTRIPLLIVALQELKQRGLLATPQPRSHMVGTRTIYEQMEIDLVRLRSEEQLDKDG